MMFPLGITLELQYYFKIQNCFDANKGGKLTPCAKSGKDIVIRVKKRPNVFVQTAVPYPGDARKETENSHDFGSRARSSMFLA